MKLGEYLRLLAEEDWEEGPDFKISKEELKEILMERIQQDLIDDAFVNACYEVYCDRFNELASEGR